MKKNTIYMKFTIFIFFAFTLYYFVLYPFASVNVSTETEKRALNSRPKLNYKTYSDFSKKFTGYYEDYIPFRRVLTNLGAKIKIELFNTSPDTSVILGKNKWLFYDSKAADGTTDELVDFSGILYTTHEMKNIVSEIQEAYDYCKNKNVEFVFMLAPNKSSVYDEFMPDKYNKLSEYTRSDQLIDYIRDNTDIPCNYVKKELRKEKNDYPLYYKTDTHWNELGGYIASQEIMKGFGVEIPDISKIKYSVTNYSGDLVNLLGVDYYSKDQRPIIEYEDNIAITVVDSDHKLGKFEYTTTNQNGKKLLILGDSFSEAIINPVGRNFSEFTYFKSRYYQMVDSKDYDYVVYELVERAVSLLKSDK